MRLGNGITTFRLLQILRCVDLTGQENCVITCMGLVRTYIRFMSCRHYNDVMQSPLL